jgi:hypothetical protein
MSIEILHNIIAESKALNWKELIVAAQSELQRIKQCAIQLRGAIQLFKKRDKAGDPCIKSKPATHF